MTSKVKTARAPKARKYDSPVRRAHAEETELRILAAAHDLFAERGYVGTSLAAIAERGEVNARTVYKIFGTKVALLSRLVDVAMVGDQAAIPVAAREWAEAAYSAPTGRERIRAYAAVVRRLMESAGSAFRAAAQAAATDSDAAALWATGQDHRLQDLERVVDALEEAHLLRPGVSRDDALATVWLVTSPETFIQLSDGLGWSLDRFEQWVEQMLADALLV